MNSIQLIGRLTKTPELQASKNTNYCRFSIAVDRVGQKDTTDFFNCTAFGKTAEVICDYVKKGNQIGISGSLETSQKDKVTYYNVIVNRVTLISSGKRNDDISDDLEEEEPRKKTTSKKAPSKPATDDYDDDDYPF